MCFSSFGVLEFSRFPDWAASPVLTQASCICGLRDLALQPDAKASNKATGDPNILSSMFRNWGVLGLGLNPTLTHQYLLFGSVPVKNLQKVLDPEPLQVCTGQP